MTSFTTPTGDNYIVLPADDYEQLVGYAEAEAHGAVMARLSGGEEETLTAQEMNDLLAAPTPLHFWRRKRDVAMEALAKTVGLSRSYLGNLESGAQKGDPIHFLKLSKALGVSMEDLVLE